ncbi:DUF4349 domain-containing protein [Anaerococcus prevotii]|uniref:Conserved domain protein n=1 Tax=Anaerococcus prevotii ACS-065-V-Col13 TaxID=879305 RepID=F0GWZ3_9FIRM|nr:DUF4349 domain-containing protein [Anaerococcus prevotii]EGC81748.1 conserved domain protein [Anaerococcus prevotii ACS-065-V-Col13]
MKKKSFIALVLTLSLSLTSCAAYNSYVTEDRSVISTKEAVDYAEEKTIEDDSSLENSEYSYDKDKKEKIYDIELESVDFDSDVSKVKDLMNDDEIMVLSQNYNSYVTDDGTLRNLNMTVKIPIDKSKDFKENVEKLGRLSSSNEYINDLNKPYVDIDKLISSKEKEITKLNELLESASTIEDTLAIQSKILEIETELDQINEDKNDLNERISYDTFNIYVREVFSYNRRINTNPNLGERIKIAFEDSFTLVKAFVFDTIVFVVRFWPFIIILLVLIIVVLRKRKKVK